MLDISVRIEGDKVLIEGLNKLAAEMPHAIDRALQRVAIGVYRDADDFLSGPGGASKKVRKDYVGFTKKGKTSAVGTYSSGEDVMFRSYKGAGGYPVPKRTSHLRRSLDWLKPGATKSITRRGEKHDVGSFTAGKHEVIIYNAALYANTIHEGKGSSAKFGRRPYLTDALERFNQGSRIKATIEEEIQKEINKGLK